MPQKARIIAGPRNVSFDHYISDIISKGDWEVEHTYFGIVDNDRADYVRRKLRTAGTHMNPPVAVKAFWTQCQGCESGGADCRYHVMFTVFDMQKAREYRAAKHEQARMAPSARRRQIN